MLGEDYPGLFPVGDARALADMLIRFRHDAEFVKLLKNHCALKVPLFSAENERKGLLTILENITSARPLS
jgi:hypothetical protein